MKRDTFVWKAFLELTKPNYPISNAGFSETIKAIERDVELFREPWTSLSGSKKAKCSATGLKSVPELKSVLNELKKTFGIQTAEIGHR